MSLITVATLVGVVAVVILLLIVAASRYKKVGPHEALITTGKGGQKVVIGGGMFVMPVLYKTFVQSLSANTVQVHRENILSKNRVPITVDAVLVYRVKGEEEAVKLAAQSFQDKNEKDIASMIEQVAEGAFRDICGRMTPEDINEKREDFQNQVTTTAQGHFDKMGIDLLSFVVTHISDPNNYFKNLGVPASAKVDKEARIERAETNKSATVSEAQQRFEGEKKTAEADADIALAQKERDVRRAEYSADVAKENAKAEQAGPKAKAIAEKDVVEEQTKLAAEKANRKEKELMADVIKPAEAGKTAKIIAAEAQRQEKILEAEGEKQALALRGEGEGVAAQKKGEGEAAGIKAKLFAEAEGLERKAKAMKEFNDAGMELQITLALIDKYPDIIKAIALPISAIDKLEIMDFGGRGNGDGASGGPIDRILDISPQTLIKAEAVLGKVNTENLRKMIQLLRKGDITAEIKDTPKTE